MKEGHIIDMLERAPFGALSDGELATIRAHAARCPDCQRAYRAARLSALLLEERVAESIEPSPFFQTRVLAALRERQRAAAEVPALRRLWQTAGAFVSSMALTVAALAALTFFSPAGAPTNGPTTLAAATDAYTAEEVVLTPDELTQGAMSDEQVLSTLYGADEAQ